MKIIEKGEKQYECKCCGCKFIIDRMDINYEIDIFNGGFYYVKCPQCHSKVKVNYEQN